jgi:hypothetical protein
VDAFGTDEVTFITLPKGYWFLGILLSHKPFLLGKILYLAPWWVFLLVASGWF